MAEQNLGKFLVFHDLEGLPDGSYLYSPRHISLIQPVRLGGFPMEYVDDIIEIASDTSPFTVYRGGQDKFGTATHGVDVTHIIDPNGNLQKMHARLLQQLGARGLDSTLPLQYSGVHYTPHSTITTSMPELPETIYIDNLSYYFETTLGKQIAKVPFGNIY